ncbi:hypothetical protein FACS1894139_03780 [Planctomycetales bacterium]|nr:hypothetical protein FACS1894107_16370 [Planctomycetales bacterium]GHS97675.1 hypothetical protein FACS1894108_04450 [Planctomycetales bacterium]GHT03459.1 hypothetical protein FACS1894139_03780 [Planctomycetales bacterium]
MHKFWRGLIIGWVGLGLAALADETPVDRQGQTLHILTGPASGIYFPIGYGFAGFLGGLGYKTQAVPSDGSVENIRNLLAGNGELAIAMADAVAQARDGAGAFAGSPPADLVAIMGLWPNVCQIVATEESGVKNFADLKGKTVSVGPAASGVELNARTIFAAEEMSYNDCQILHLAYGDAIAAMATGECDAAFVTSGLGNDSLRRLSQLGAGKKTRFIPLTGAALKRLTAKHPYYLPTTIAENNAQSITVMNVLLARRALPDAVVYDLLSNLWSPAGLAAVGKTHAVAQREIKWENALRGLENIPLHPGAIKFYQDKGLLPAK